jgi:hypothetical protein
MSISTIARRLGVSGAIAGMAVVATVSLSNPASAATTFFRITNVNSGLALTATSATTGAKVIQSFLPIPGQSNVLQQWSIRTNSGTAALTYVLRQKISSGGQQVDGCLDLPRDVDRDQQFAGEVLVVRPCDGTNSQRWLDVNTSSNGTLNMENKLSLMKIDVDNNKPLSAGAVALQNNVSQPSQRFFRVPVATV